MWHSRSTELPGGHGLKLSITQDNTALSYANVIHNWQQNSLFRDFFIELLATSTLAEFRWETPPVTSATGHRPFEFVLLHSPSLARSADQHTFSHHFQTDQSVVTFDNLGQDALLVVPCPRHPTDDYSHLGAFIQKAPKPQQHELWMAVGHAMAQRLSTEPVWLSTAGDGVAWLHVRLDDAPKYYHHRPYRTNQ